MNNVKNKKTKFSSQPVVVFFRPPLSLDGQKSKKHEASKITHKAITFTHTENKRNKLDFGTGSQHLHSIRLLKTALDS